MIPAKRSHGEFLRALLALTFFFFIQPALADRADPGPFPAGWRQVTITRPNATTFTARLHYPASAPGGQNAPLDPAGAPYPAITFGHGFVQAVTQYQSTCQHLATHGYLVIAPDSEGGLSPSHANFAADLRHALTWLESENASPASTLFGAVNVSAFGAGGHSMGGGASILAAAADARIRCLANLAAAETNPSAIAAMPSIRVPLFLITGSQDGIVAPATNGQAMYAAAGAPRQLPLITGGFHCGFTDNTFLFCDSGAISRAAQLAITRRLLTSFFDLHLKLDQSVWPDVWGPTAPPGDEGVMLTTDSGLLVTASPQQVAAAPGAISDPLTLTITNNTRSTSTVLITIESPTGWSAAAITPELAPGTSTVLTITARAPGLAAPAADTLLISARSATDNATRGYATAAAARRACIADWNGVGGRTVQDLFDFLAEYFSTSADFNGLGGTTIQDIFDFLAAYFAGCA